MTYITLSDYNNNIAAAIPCSLAWTLEKRGNFNLARPGQKTLLFSKDKGAYSKFSQDKSGYSTLSGHKGSNALFSLN